MSKQYLLTKTSKKIMLYISELRSENRKSEILTELSKLPNYPTVKEAEVALRVEFPNSSYSSYYCDITDYGGAGVLFDVCGCMSAGSVMNNAIREAFSAAEIEFSECNRCGRFILTAFKTTTPEVVEVPDVGLWRALGLRTDAIIHTACPRCREYEISDNRRNVYYLPRTRSDFKILSYGTKPAPIFWEMSDGSSRPTASKTASLDNMQFGLEVELSAGGRGDPSKLLDSLYNMGLWRFLYCKTDGSLSSDGVEVVTHPITLSIIRKIAPKIIDAATASGYAVPDGRGGLHIHIGKSVFGKNENERRFGELCLSAIFAAADSEKLSKIARRDLTSSHWANVRNIYNLVVAPTTTSEKDLFFTVSEMLYKLDDCDRYHAINITNSTTTECRIFAAVESTEDIVAAVEIFGRFCRYAGQMSPRLVVKRDAVAALFEKIISGNFSAATKKYLSKVGF